VGFKRNMTGQGTHMLNYLDVYCERAGAAGLWAEPVNAITNLAFLVAALLVARHLVRQKFSSIADLWALALILFSIGVGSGLWHLYATHATLLADVIPIALFMHLFLISALRRLFQCSWGKTLAGWLLFVVATIAGEIYLPSAMLNGSVMYLPALVALMLLTAGLVRRRHPAARDFLVALGVFLISVTFRTVDMALCETFTLGTHFLWHLLNAYLLWRLLMALVLCVSLPRNAGQDATR
jgi:hypothetical protein